MTIIKEFIEKEITDITKYGGLPSHTEIVKHEECCKNIVLNDADDLPIAKHIIANALDISKMIEDRRKEVKKPYLTACKTIDNLFKVFMSSLDEEIKQAKERIVAFQENNNAKRNFRKVWKYRVTNLDKIPNKFLIDNKTAIMEFISENKDEINKGEIHMMPGVEFYIENSLVL